MEKDFNGWHRLKIALDSVKQPPTFQEREIWWCSIGINVGYEMYGKGHIFTRPVLVLRKYSRFTFLGVPLSSRMKDSPYYHPINFRGRDVSAVFDQVRI